MEFKQVLKMRRKAMGRTQREVGEWLGIRDVNISDWERGDSMPETGRLSTLAKKLGLTVGELMGEIQEDDPRLHGPHAMRNRTVLPPGEHGPQRHLTPVKMAENYADEMGLMWISPWEFQLLTKCRLTDEQGRDAIMTAADQQPKPLAAVFRRDKAE